MGNNNLLRQEIRGKLFEYLAGNMQETGLLPLAVNGIEDHVHLFFELPPTISVSKALQKVKANSSQWINDEKLVNGKFQWQNGFGAFTHSRSQRDGVIHYIHNQESHHALLSFRDEFMDMLSKYNVAYNQNRLFEFYVLEK